MFSKTNQSSLHLIPSKRNTRQLISLSITQEFWFGNLSRNILTRTLNTNYVPISKASLKSHLPFSRLSNKVLSTSQAFLVLLEPQAQVSMLHPSGEFAVLLRALRRNIQNFFYSQSALASPQQR